MGRPFEFTLQFRQGIGQVDAQKGVLLGVTVAEVGDATGHFAFADAAGRIVGVGGAGDGENFKGATKRLQLAMDERSLLTVVAAGKQAKRFKTREDHDDAIEARAGFSENFRMDGGKVVCDLTTFDSYRNRAVFLEAATLTPELIGLSGDFKFTAEVVGDRAMMRVTRIDAVDIVDQGAVTHAGLFKVKPQVDIPEKDNSAQFMAKDTDVPDMKAFKSMCESVAAYRAKNAASAAEIDECMACLQIDPVKVPTPEGAPAPVQKPASNPDASVKDDKANFAALKAELTTELSASFSTMLEAALDKSAKAQQVEFQKQLSALGMKPAPVKEPTDAEKAEAVRLAAELAAKDKEKGAPAGDFLSLRAARAKEKNISMSEASRQIISEQPEVFRQYQIGLGIIRK